MSIAPAILTALNTTQDQLVKKMIDDVRTIYSSMLGIELMHLPLEVDPMSQFQDCVSAMVGLGGTYSGLVSVHVPTGLAKTFAGAMLGMDVEEVDQDVYDALGEIANMVAGNFKQHISKGGGDVRISTPSVISGKDYIVQCKQNDSINLLFDVAEEWFMVSTVLSAD